MQTHHDIRASIAQKQMNEIQGQNFTQALAPVQNKIDQHMTLQAFNKLPDEAKSSFSMADAQKKYANAMENPNEILGSLSPGGTQGRDPEFARERSRGGRHGESEARGPGPKQRGAHEGLLCASASCGNRKKNG